MMPKKVSAPQGQTRRRNIDRSQIATSLVTGLSSTGFDYLYALRVLTPLIPLWLFRGYYADLRWSWAWTPIILGLLVFVLWVALEPEPTPEAAAQYRRGRISDAIVAHGVTNALLAAYVLIFGHWAFW